MITGFRVGNFKAFGATQRIPIKPITVILGPNSSGKSSIIHSLAFAHEAEGREAFDVTHTSIGGDSIDLGGFRQYVYQRQAKNRVHWGVELGLSGSLEPTSVNLDFTLGMPLDDQDQPKPNAKPEVMTLELHFGGELFMRMSHRPSDDVNPNTRLAMDRIETDLPIIRYALEKHIKSFKAELKYRRHEESRVIDEDKVRAIAAEEGLTLESLEEGAAPRIFPNLPDDIVELLLTREEITEEDLKIASKALDYIFSQKIEMPLVGLIPKPSSLKKLFRDFLDSESFQEEHGPLPDKWALRDLEWSVYLEFTDHLRSLLYMVMGTAWSTIQKLDYLGPLRSYPPRRLFSSEQEQINWRAGGGADWQAVLHGKDIRESVNKWLSDEDRLQTKYELRVRNLVPIEEIGDALEEGLERIELDPDAVEENSDWGEQPDGISDSPIGVGAKIKDPEKEAENLQAAIAKEDLNSLSELVLFDKRTETVVSHRDVGIGVSQVLPVLVRAFASTNRIIMIEQPEIHLHPALQAELGDVFIESALGDRKNTFILETHSEHMLLRLMRRMRETARGDLDNEALSLTPDDVMVLYVEPVGSSSIVREMPLNEHGELVKAWPGGFFEEGLKEVF